MAKKKSKYNESHSVSVEGVFDRKNMTIEIEDIGVKELQEVLAKLDGMLINIDAVSSSDLD